MPVNNSPNMNLPVPVVGSEPGPDYASDVNTSLTTIDSHDHTSGKGVQITPSGININSDLTLNNQNLTNIKNLVFSTQSSPSSSNGSLSESGVDLYFTDGNGNQIRITQSGSIAGAAGSISGLASPASASYSSGSQTFVWQSGASIAANMDCGSVIFRNLSPNSTFGVTVSAPSSLSSNYSVVLPALPASQKIMTLDSSGNMSAPYVVDNSTIEVSANTIQVKDLGVSTAKLAAQAVTAAKIANNTITASQVANATLTTTQLASNANIAVTQLATPTSANGTSTGSYTTTSATFTTVCSVTVTAVGRPIDILFNNPNLNTCYFGVNSPGLSGSVALRLRNSLGANVFANGTLANLVTSGGTVRVPASVMNCVDLTPGTGSVTYTLEAQCNGSAQFQAQDVIMYALVR